jgi:hypothetical protein
VYVITEWSEKVAKKRKIVERISCVIFGHLEIYWYGYIYNGVRHRERDGGINESREIAIHSFARQEEVNLPRLSFS